MVHFPKFQKTENVIFVSFHPVYPTVANVKIISLCVYTASFVCQNIMKQQ